MKSVLPTPFEDALDKTGNGKYNYLLVLSCGCGLLGIGVDLFGFSVLVTAACDLNITVAQKGILTSLPFVGILLVSYIWGCVADTMGRRFSLVVSMLVSFILSSIASLSPNWIALGVIKFISVCFSCATNSVAYTMVGESCIQEVRSKYMVLMTSLLLVSPGIAAIVSYPILLLDFAAYIPLLDITFRPWRLLNIVLALPLGFTGIALLFFHESPKFLANRGNIDEALEVLKSIYATNSKKPRETFEIDAIVLQETTVTKNKNLFLAMFEQSAPLFRPPLLGRTLQLFYIVAIVYLVNNTILVWLPHIMNTIVLALESESADSGSVCHLISVKEATEMAKQVVPSNETVVISPNSCTGTLQQSMVVTMLGAQFTFACLNIVVSYLPFQRRSIVLAVLSLSAVSGFLLNFVPDPIASVTFFMLFTCTCLAMGILASYFVDLYPTSCRGMVSCLSIMVGRTTTFIGINVVGNVLFTYCNITFYIGAFLVFTSVIAAWFLPLDKPVQKPSNVS